jgi:hypothetical protein
VRFGWVVLAVLVGACSESKSSAPRGLRVPLPDGWAANAGASGVLKVGPKGRVVLTLERRTAALPSIEALKAAVEAEGAVVVRGAGAADSTTVRYTKPSAAGLLAVRTLENGVLLLCASTPEAALEELEAAESLCSAVRLEAIARP